ncbi:MAG: hypothetical protein Rhims3KO_15210 [Hyphomicrobiales bacterium]
MRTIFHRSLVVAFLLASQLVAGPTIVSHAWADQTQVSVDVWADNWFELYIDGQRVLQDSVPITTERSFNAESATFPVTLPAQIAFMAMDFRENDSGLEYIGTQRQQMGDGGFIAQFRDAATGRVLGATNSSVRCTVIHRAPVDRSCAREANPVAGQGACSFQSSNPPASWTSASFDDSNWPNASVHSAADVRPKDGYDRIRWDNSAQLIWSPDLVQDNTILCRMTLEQ